MRLILDQNSSGEQSNSARMINTQRCQKRNFSDLGDELQPHIPAFSQVSSMQLSASPPEAWSGIKSGDQDTLLPSAPDDRSSELEVS
jgi:hypothetical protein